MWSPLSQNCFRITRSVRLEYQFPSWYTHSTVTAVVFIILHIILIWVIGRRQSAFAFFLINNQKPPIWYSTQLLFNISWIIMKTSVEFRQKWNKIPPKLNQKLAKILRKISQNWLKSPPKLVKIRPKTGQTWSKNWLKFYQKLTQNSPKILTKFPPKIETEIRPQIELKCNWNYTNTNTNTNTNTITGLYKMIENWCLKRQHWPPRCNCEVWAMGRWRWELGSKQDSLLLSLIRFSSSWRVCRWPSSTASPKDLWERVSNSKQNVS